MKKIANNSICILLFLVFIIWLPLKSFAQEKGAVLYWYSNGNVIAHWNYTPTCSRSIIDGENSYYLGLGYNHALSQWNAVSGIYISDYGIYNSATDIKCYEAYKYTIATYYGVYMSSDALGVTYSGFTSSIPEVTYNYYGTTKEVYILSYSAVFITDRNDSLSHHENVYTHEMGHALGWRDHSLVSTDVMYYSASNVTVLTTRDKDHLMQIYT